jgi:hypothetical protein
MNMEEKEFLRNESVYVRRSAAGSPNTSDAVLAELAKDSHWSVRRSAAGNPNTSGAVLAELAKDSHWSVRRSAAGNPNADEPIKYKFIVTKTYVATNGTNNIWYKHNYPNIEPFYTCGCFCGSRKALISRFYSTDCYIDPSIRMRILSALDEKFKEVFGR